MAFDPLATLGLRLAQDPEEQALGAVRQATSNELGGLFSALQTLQQANASDTAPTIEAAQVRSPVNFLTALGAAIQDPFRPGTVQALAQRQAAVDRANAQLQQQAELANQVQEGYLERRRQQREGAISDVQRRIAETRSEADKFRAKIGLDKANRNLDFQQRRELIELEASLRKVGQQNKDTALDEQWIEGGGRAGWMQALQALKRMDAEQLVKQFGEKYGTDDPSRIRTFLIEDLKDDLTGLSDHVANPHLRALSDAISQLGPIDDGLGGGDDRKPGGAIGSLPGQREVVSAVGRGARAAGRFIDEELFGGAYGRIFGDREERAAQAAQDLSDLGLAWDFLNSTEIPTSEAAADSIDSMFPVGSASSMLDSLRERATSQLLSNIGGKTKGSR